MEAKKISDFPTTTINDTQKILIEENGEAKSITISAITNNVLNHIGFSKLEYLELGQINPNVPVRTNETFIIQENIENPVILSVFLKHPLETGISYYLPNSLVGLWVTFKKNEEGKLCVTVIHSETDEPYTVCVVVGHRK